MLTISFFLHILKNKFTQFIVIALFIIKYEKVFFVSYFSVHTFKMCLCSYLNKICFHTTSFSYFLVSLDFESVVCQLTKEVKREEAVDFTQ